MNTPAEIELVGIPAWRIRGSDLLILPDLVEDKTLKSGIILSAQSQKRSCSGTVLIVGPGLIKPDGTINSRSLVVSVGDRVIYNKFTQLDANIDGTQYEVVDIEDIKATCDASAVIYQTKKQWGK